MSDILQKWNLWIGLYPMISKFTVVLIAFFIIMGIVYSLKSRINSVVEESTTRYRMRKAVTLIAYLIFVVIAIATFKKDMSGFAVMIGVIAGGIAFALQEVIISIAGWLAITFSSFYRVGDRIKIGSIYGDVIDIGILRTTLMECGAWVNSDLYNGRIVRVTNSFIFKDPVYNYSGEFPFLWDEIILPIRYGSSVEHTRQTLMSIADDVVGDFTESVRESWQNLSKLYAVESATVEPMVTISATDNWIEFTLRYVVDFKKRRSTRDQLFTRFLVEVEKSEGKIQMASQTSEIVSFPKLHIQSENIQENIKN
ncbi:MAG: mechanosensitive ion channel family protein [Sulfuricurvum sp.]|uniref:mechanosensitive ion channel family protein n=1 Tax=Sulfuricurvum sp. TaxID=2025608 RepID=UPI00262E9421|nr:mechanosensitive ion channel family protein [Sulfuricurvum sp.]MDD2368844.1 mechanosensitive ion channel family protein [Sulfuricurvum sp.]MDD2950240.1 mechanosensitive ion channel family protein [Sulfuricurvum sp.]MDD5119569.1 mechanosensitive ion channel family protein [Sulfuricurvum sp.]